MRRLFPLPAGLLAAIVIAGCGGGGDGKSALDNALGYLPEDTPFAAALDTDLEGSQFKAGGEIVDKFPFGEQALESLKQQLGEDVDFEQDVKPLLGNPFVVGAPDAKSFTSDEETVFVGAIEAKDGDKLKELVERQDAKEVGEKEGAKLYEDNDDVFAINDDVLIVADSRETIEAALEQRKADDRMSEGTFGDALEQLSEDAALRVYSNVQGLLDADSSTEDARKVKWVDALRTLGLTASVQSGKVAIDFNLATDSGGLAEEDVPLASGSASPEVFPERGRISVGVRDPSQIYTFGLGAARAIDPEGTGEFETAISAIEQRLKVDREEDILDQLTGDVSVNFDIDGTFAARAEVKDAEAVQQTLRKIARGLPRFVRQGGDVLGVARRGPFFALADPGGTTVVFGVVNGDLIVSNNGERAGQMARLSSESVSGAEGAVVVNGDTEQIVGQALRRLGLQAAIGGAILTAPLGDLTGSLEADTDGIRGSLSQAID
ncbi:MAG: DUF3352 domain-containing protein [Thermoleophilaceae bacterium]|nr:DUF3352 domain-containing protein [Thermoleophilaceae bacterium]